MIRGRGEKVAVAVADLGGMSATEVPEVLKRVDMDVQSSIRSRNDCLYRYHINVNPLDVSSGAALFLPCILCTRHIYVEF